MPVWKFRKRKVVEAAWVLLQSFALLAILFMPLWIRQTPGTLSERFKNIQHIDEAPDRDRRPTSITSRVITIPGPAFRNSFGSLNEWSEELESETRQIRFEWGLSSEPKEEWRLANIERKTSQGTWENVSLVSNEFGMPIGSVYVELVKGSNEFNAEVVSKKTRAKKKILLRIAQKR